MASLFTPENERMRAGEKKASSEVRTPGQSIRVPGTGAVEKQEKPGDTLGGGSGSLGYEPWGKKKGQAEPEKSEAAGPAGQVIETTEQGPGTIRLSAGWELILVAQKKLCAKAKGIFTLLEGPVKYTSQKKNNFLLSKSRGSILDLDLQETQAKLAWKLKQEKEKESA